MATKLEPTLDHYWPKSISSFWSDSGGQVNRLSWDAELVRSPPKNFGALKKGHQIRFGGFWDTTIEPLFNSADSNTPHVVKYLLSLESKIGIESLSFQERLLGHTLTESMRANLGEILASLIVRSPAFRHNKNVAVTNMRQGLPYHDYIDEQNLIVANMNQEYRGIVRSLKSGGKIVVLFSDTNEFIFGEGFLNNLNADSLINQKLFIPITPTMCVALSRPISYSSNFNTVTVRLSAKEVDKCNEITQVYTRDYIYFRYRPPRVISAFSERSFLMFEYHKHQWLDNLLDAACGFRG